MARRSWRRRARQDEPAPDSSSPPSFRCAGIRRKISSCVRRFSMPCARELAALASGVRGTPVVVGFPERDGGARYNSLAVLADGRVTAVYRKQQLPNYTGSTRSAISSRGASPCVIDVERHGGRTSDLRGCLVRRSGQAGAGGGRAGDRRRQRFALSHATAGGAARAGRRQGARDRASVRLRQPGRGQDELVFDGASFVMDAQGDVVQQLPGWHETVALVTLDQGAPRAVRGALDPRLEYHVYEALVMGVRDYVTKNRFPGVLLGSVRRRGFRAGARGGSGRAGTGPRARSHDAFAVHAVDQPRGCAGNGIDRPRPIQRDSHRADVRSVRAALADEFKGLPPDAAEENIQARIRGTLLMALSNKRGSIVLTTGNKSEMAVGYATLYGDMAGGFGVLKDISKTLVYRLCAYRNGLGRVIPERIITRPPSAELRPDQVDQDSLPPYDAARRDPGGVRRARQEPGRHRCDGLRPRACAAGRQAHQDQ